MVQPLKRYPDNSINVNAGPVRSFKEGYKSMLEDIIDTMKEHNLNALSAIQIGYPYQLMVIKNGDKYDVYANPRVIKQSEPFESIEKSSYFYDTEFKVTRYAKLSIVYDDENGNMQTKKIEDKDYAATFLRKVDYLFNTSLLDRLKPHDRAEMEKLLANKGYKPNFLDETCPTNSKKDYFISVADKLLFFMFVSLLLPIFNISKETLNSWYKYDKFATVAVFLLLIGYFIYAQYEAKKYKQCTSCQIGNQIGIIAKRLIALILLATGAYFILG